MNDNLKTADSISENTYNKIHLEIVTWVTLTIWSRNVSCPERVGRDSIGTGRPKGYCCLGRRRTDIDHCARRQGACLSRTLSCPPTIFAENRCYNGFHGHSGSSQVGVGRLGTCHVEVAPTQLACIATTVARHSGGLACDTYGWADGCDFVGSRS